MASGFQKTAVEEQILHSEQGIAIAQSGRLCVVIWRGGVTATKFERQREGLAQVVHHHPDGVGFLCVIEADTKPPNEALRRASAEMIASHGDHLKCTAVVIEGNGFWAAITRSVISGMALMVSRRVHAVFSNISSALKWMHHHVPVGSINATTHFVEDLRKELDSLPEHKSTQ